MNDNIPQFLPPTVKGETLRNTWDYIKDDIKNIIDDADKTILIGLKRLPEESKPRDKTLRKLYLYINGHDNDISDFIEAIKKETLHLRGQTIQQEQQKVSLNFLLIFQNMSNKKNISVKIFTDISIFISLFYLIYSLKMVQLAIQ
ncbi:TPA: hypothetical protein ACYSHZ_005115 [Klebsiella pneumoniae]